jgi:hypothetical protein
MLNLSAITPSQPTLLQMQRLPILKNIWKQTDMAYFNALFQQSALGGKLFVKIIGNSSGIRIEYFKSKKSDRQPLRTLLCVWRLVRIWQVRVLL